MALPPLPSVNVSTAIKTSQETSVGSVGTTGAIFNNGFPPESGVDTKTILMVLGLAIVAFVVYKKVL